MMSRVIIKILVLWILYENSYQCREECVDCRSGNQCHGCEDEYFLKSQQCFKCNDGCLTCKFTHYNCSAACKPGYWGDWCQYSCIPCKDCISSFCTSNCRDAESRQCFNSSCPSKCSVYFTGRRKNHTVPKTAGLILKPTHQPSPTTILPPAAKTTTKTRSSSHSTILIATQDPQTQSTTQQIPTYSKPNHTKVKRKTNPYFTTQHKATLFLGHDTTTKQSDVTEYSVQPSKEDRANRNGTTEQTESQPDGLDPTVGYIVIAAVGVLVLAVATFIVVIVCIKRRNSRQDQVANPQDANNKAESRQLTDNAGIYSNVSNHDNAIRNVATIKVAESDTGFVDMKATAYENVVDKTAMNTSDTVNVYEAFNQYTNVREMENKYTSLIGNENVYYNVLDK